MALLVNYKIYPLLQGFKIDKIINIVVILYYYYIISKKSFCVSVSIEFENHSTCFHLTCMITICISHTHAQLCNDELYTT